MVRHRRNLRNRSFLNTPRLETIEESMSSHSSNKTADMLREGNSSREASDDTSSGSEVPMPATIEENVSPHSSDQTANTLSEGNSSRDPLLNADDTSSGSSEVSIPALNFPSIF